MTIHGMQSDIMRSNLPNYCELIFNLYELIKVKIENNIVTTHQHIVGISVFYFSFNDEQNFIC